MPKGGYDKTEMDRWKTAYHEHWLRVLAAEKIIDNQTRPIINFSQQKVKGTMGTMIRRLKENMGVMMNIASMLSAEGKINTFREDKYKLDPSSKEKAAAQVLDLIEAENRFFGNRLLNMTATFSTFENNLIMRKKTRKEKETLQTAKMR